MPKNNKIYWSLGVTEKGTRALLTDENSKFRWLRSQKNRRVLVVLQALGIVLVSLGSYYPMLKVNLSSGQDLVFFGIAALLAIALTLISYSLLRVAVRGIADAPDDLLDERQVLVRNSSYRHAYLALGYVVAVLFALLVLGPNLTLFESGASDASYLMIGCIFAFATLPSMILAWREKDI